MHNPLVIIGYSGHAYVVIESALVANFQVSGYFEQKIQEKNPYNLSYLGSENDPNNLPLFQNHEWFVCIGENTTRRKVQESVIINTQKSPSNIIHKQTFVAQKIQLGVGILINAGVVIQPLASIGNGVICNTGCIIEHECIIGNYVHLSPGSVLCGNVIIGENSWIGANSVIRQGISIGSNVTIGAGSVVIRDVPDGMKIAGNPAKPLS